MAKDSVWAVGTVRGQPRWAATAPARQAWLQRKCAGCENPIQGILGRAGPKKKYKEVRLKPFNAMAPPFSVRSLFAGAKKRLKRTRKLPTRLFWPVEPPPRFKLLARSWERADLFLLVQHTAAHTGTPEPTLWLLKPFCTSFR
jgi:hypothetical protein